MKVMLTCTDASAWIALAPFRMFEVLRMFLFVPQIGCSVTNSVFVRPIGIISVACAPRGRYDTTKHRLMYKLGFN